MKPFRLVVIVASFSIFFAAFCGVVFALDQDEVRVSVAWSSEIYSRGSSQTVTVLLISDSSEQLTINYFGLHVDWMDSDQFIGSDLSDDPVIIPAYGNEYFSPITIQIPEDVSVGPHSYFLGIDGIQGVSTSFSWDSPTLTLVVQNSGIDIYSELVNKVGGNISEAVNANYQSSEAKSLLNQAQNVYDQALSLGNEEKWNEAISTLQDASTYLKQADNEEQKHIETNTQQDTLLIIVGVAVVVTVLIITLVMIKRKQNPIVDQQTKT